MNNPIDFTAKRTILVVDDVPDNLNLMGGLLRGEYRVKLATNGERALEIASGEGRPDLILLDIMMPKMDGYEVLRHLQANERTRNIPVMFLTAMDDEDDEKVGLDLGAVDYITKPLKPAVLFSRVRNHLELSLARQFLESQKQYLEEEVQRRTRQIMAMQDVTIRAMASLAETRDNETGNHIRRTQHYVRALALALMPLPRFAGALDLEQVDLLYKSAPLHDIGKVGIPDRILLKPGKLTAEEFEIMKTHTTVGYNAIAEAEGELDEPNPFLRYGKEIALSHQEKWDGSGYPQGLVGTQIPLSARLMAVADVYDALISRRVYKPAFTHERAVEIIQEGRGKHFDPEIADTFVTIAEQFRDIAARYVDEDDTPVGTSTVEPAQGAA